MRPEFKPRCSSLWKIIHTRFNVDLSSHCEIYVVNFNRFIFPMKDISEIFAIIHKSYVIQNFDMGGALTKMFQYICVFRPTELQNFANSHPEFSSKIPSKYGLGFPTPHLSLKIRLQMLEGGPQTSMCIILLCVYVYKL